MKKILIFVLIAIIGAVAASCSQGDGKTKGKNDKQAAGDDSPAASGPPGYDLQHPVKYSMPTDLLEISGIAFNNGDNKTMYAQQDEDGRIFYFTPGDSEAKNAKFGKQGDYEDVAIGNNQAVILRSDGELHSFPLAELASGQINSQKVKNLVPAGEYEAMYFDNGTKKLYILCKQCDADKSSGNNAGYIFNLGADGTISKSGEFSVTAGYGGEQKKGKLRPSALAKNPVTGQWFILSSINKLLVVTDEKWAVQASYALKGFLQPEGMAFDSQANLYISNEGDELSNGNVLLFKYTKPKNN